MGLEPRVVSAQSAPQEPLAAAADLMTQMGVPEAHPSVTEGQGEVTTAGMGIIMDIRVDQGEGIFLPMEATQTHWGCRWPR